MHTIGLLLLSVFLIGVGILLALFLYAFLGSFA